MEQNNTQYDLDRQSAKISASSWGNVSKYECLTGKYVLPEKDLLDKTFISNKDNKNMNESLIDKKLLLKQK